MDHFRGTDTFQSNSVQYKYCIVNKKCHTKNKIVYFYTPYFDDFESWKKAKVCSWSTSKLISNIQQPNRFYTLTQRSQWLYVKILPICVSTVTLSCQLSSPLFSSLHPLLLSSPSSPHHPLISSPLYPISSLSSSSFLSPLSPPPLSYLYSSL